MHRLCLLVLALLLGACAHAPGRAPLVATPAYLDQLSVELVFHDEDGSIQPYCSGTWIGPHAILTASHCMDGAAFIATMDPFAEAEDGLEVEYALKGEENFARPAKLVEIDRKRDLALLYTKGSAPAFARLGPAPKIGDRVFTDGHHYGFPWSYTEGKVSAIRVQDGPEVYAQGCKVIQMDIDDGPGDSGSGVFDEAGRLVGVTSYEIRRASIVFAIHRDAVEDFL